MTANSWMSCALALATASALSSCLPRPPSLLPEVALPAGEAAVQGHVIVWSEDKAVIGGPGQRIPVTAWDLFSLAVVSETTSQTFGQRLTDGTLSWHLPPGRYTITGFDRAGRQSGRVGASFEVPSGAAAVCLGTLHLAFQSSRPWIEVEDTCDVDGSAASATRALFRPPESELAGARFDPTLTGKLKIAPLVFWGVRPLSPMSGERVATLAPNLKWEPLGEDLSQGLSYDIRIFRMVEVPGWTWGPLVVARDGLTEPTFQVEEPLTPRSKYAWFVRQRRGDRVGPWSYHDSRVILILYNSWTQGAPLEFWTP